MRVLITGALGFIGGHLVDAYLERGHEVLGIDDMSGNVVPRIEGMRLRICDAREINLVDRSIVPDLVVHAASPVGAVALLERSSIVAEIIETTQAVLRFCEQRRVPLVNISSSEVYGFSGIYSESDSCVVPHRLSHRLQYAAGKLAAEQLVRTSPVTSVTIRPFNVAGPRQARSKGFVLPTFVEQALAGEPLTVFGGEQERCLTAVWDVVDFIAEPDRVFTDPAVYNVGNPANRISVRGLAERVISELNSTSEIVFTDGKTVHGPAYEEALGIVKVPDITRAQATGWQPLIGIDEMITRTAGEARAAWAVFR